MLPARPLLPTPFHLQTVCTEDVCALSGSCNRFGCSACKPPGYDMDAQDTCRPVNVLGCNDPRCLTCKPGDPFRCTQCIEGYGLDWDHVCRKVG